MRLGNILLCSALISVLSVGCGDAAESRLRIDVSSRDRFGAIERIRRPADRITANAKKERRMTFLAPTPYETE